MHRPVHPIPPLKVPAETSRRIKLVCPYCGSEELRRDGWAVWDTENQEWALGDTFDNIDCNDCGAEKVNATEVEIP